MDEFLRNINSHIYQKWILQQKYDNLKIEFDKDNNNIINITNDVLTGKIIYYGQGIFEEELSDISTKEKIFYLHFQFNYFNHAVELFKEMVICANEATNKPQIKVLLCCSGGLTTTLFASKMQELANLENIPYQVNATGYGGLFERANEYDIIMLAPQVSYLLPQAKRRLLDKEVIVIPTKIFATNDFVGALKIVYNYIKESGL